MRTTGVMIVLGLTWIIGCGGSTQSSHAPEDSTADTATTPAETDDPEPSSAPASDAPAPERRAGPDEEPGKVDVPPSDAPLSRIMEAHFQDALLIRKAVIAGRYEHAAEPARVIAELEDLDGLPTGWSPFVEHMRETAKRITDSTTAAAAAGAVADLGVSCGLCHQKVGGPRPPADAAPPADNTVEARMRRHAWATDRLWDGLSVPSTDAWDQGAKALSTEPFPKELLDAGGVDVRTTAKDFARLARKAPAQNSAQARAALYAELLVTCGTCHQVIKQEK